MTLAQIIKDIAHWHRVPTDLASGFVQDAIEELVRVIDSGEEVKVRGLGTFRWQKARARSGTGTLNGSEIPEGMKLRFLPARRFRGRRTSMSDTDARSHQRRRR